MKLAFTPLVIPKQVLVKAIHWIYSNEQDITEEYPCFIGGRDNVLLSKFDPEFNAQQLFDDHRRDINELIQLVNSNTKN